MDASSCVSFWAESSARRREPRSVLHEPRRVTAAGGPQFASLIGTSAKKLHGQLHGGGAPVMFLNSSSICSQAGFVLSTSHLAATPPWHRPAACPVKPSHREKSGGCAARPLGQSVPRRSVSSDARAMSPAADARRGACRPTPSRPSRQDPDTGAAG